MAIITIASYFAIIIVVDCAATVGLRLAGRISDPLSSGRPSPHSNTADACSAI